MDDFAGDEAEEDGPGCDDHGEGANPKNCGEQVGGGSFVVLDGRVYEGGTGAEIGCEISSRDQCSDHNQQHDEGECNFYSVDWRRRKTSVKGEFVLVAFSFCGECNEQ